MIYLLFALSNAASVNWGGNVTLTNNQNGQFNYRGSAVIFLLNTLTSAGGAVDIQQGNTAKFTGSVAKFDASIVGFPNAWAASLVVEASSAGGVANYAGQGSFSGLAFASVEEVDPANKTVTTVSLDKVTWTAGPYQDPAANKGLAQVEFTAGGTILNPFTAADAIKLTAVMSTTYGKLDTGAILTPNAVETIFEVKNWKLKDPANNLRLTLWTGQGSRTSSGTVNVNTGAFKNWVVGSGAYASYFSTASVAKSGASTTINVQIDVSARASSELPSNLVGAATLGGTGSWHANRVFVSFPAGVSSFVYDPAVGANELPQSSAWALKPLIALAAILVALLF